MPQRAAGGGRPSWRGSPRNQRLLEGEGEGEAGRVIGRQASRLRRSPPPVRAALLSVCEPSGRRSCDRRCRGESCVVGSVVVLLSCAAPAALTATPQAAEVALRQGRVPPEAGWSQIRSKSRTGTTVLRLWLEQVVLSSPVPSVPSLIFTRREAEHRNLLMVDLWTLDSVLVWLHSGVSGSGGSPDSAGHSR